MLRNKLIELRDYYVNELKTLDSIDRTCCDQTEYETIESVIEQINFVLKEPESSSIISTSNLREHIVAEWIEQNTISNGNDITDEKLKDISQECEDSMIDTMNEVIFKNIEG